VPEEYFSWMTNFVTPVEMAPGVEPLRANVFTRTVKVLTLVAVLLLSKRYHE
jgi:hypothetical protein